MEVSGRTQTGKENILCQPCHSDDDDVPAEGYCETCNEYFCSSCLRVHRKQSVTKNHVIKLKDEMPRVQIQTDRCSELCAVHKTEIVKFYCQRHNSVGCCDCMVLTHKSCSVQLVSDVSGNYGNCEELHNIKKEIEELQKKIKASKYEIQKNLKVADDVKVKIIAEIKSFREEMNSYLDTVETELIREVEMINAKDVSEQSQFLNECKSIENEMSEFQRNLDQYADKINQLFVTAKLAQTKLHACQKITKDIASKSQMNIYKFERSKDMDTLKKSHISIGTITRQMSKSKAQIQKDIADMKAHYVKKFDVKATNESAVCWITGLARLSSDEILLADYNNQSLKILNVRDNAIISRYQTVGSPWDVSVINTETIAATLPSEGNILFVNTKNGLSESHSLKVRNNCRGIDHRNGVIGLAYGHPPAVQILNMKGDILHEVKDTSLLQYPEFIAVIDDTNIIISDSYKSAAYHLTIDGHLQVTKKFERLQSIRGLAVTSNGTDVFCCPKNSGRLSIVLPNTGKTLPFYVQHVQKPFNILICEEESNLFLSEDCGSGDSDPQTNFINNYQRKLIKVTDVKKPKNNDGKNTVIQMCSFF
ncbi:tripartite motif-containing protein 66-like [Mercenaria mercenaria]|uniref:tripartite motif-containing protein 66-like n=1 Tax=Mercenaria mercenaria TaxID=6596 RepID=UPI00234F5F9D|nr:tripartite motif-containing protein 66-like [Mercenaria mercenaria]